MDTISIKLRDDLFIKYANRLQKASKVFDQNVTCFATSIWNETLFKAWSYIIGSLLNDEILLKKELDILCRKCKCDEMILFESKTFLFIAHSTIKLNISSLNNLNTINNGNRFERIANIIKNFKLRRMKTNKLLQSMVVANSKFSVYIGPFTDNTYILSVISDDKIEIDGVKLNLNASQRKFEKLMAVTGAVNA